MLALLADVIELRDTGASLSSQAQLERIAWIDVAKGLIISLVVLFHTLPPQIVADLINPAACTFFFLSGLTARDGPVFRIVWKRFRQLMIPYYVMAAVNIAIWLAAKLAISHQELVFPVRDVVINVAIVRTAVGTIPLNLIPLWFLPAVFVMELYFSVFKKIHLLPVAIAAGFAGMFFLPGSLPFKLDVALSTMPFYALGRVLGSRRELISFLPFHLTLLSGILYLPLAAASKEVYLMEDYFGPLPALYILASFSGIVAISGISQIICKSPVLRDYFTRLGRKTLFILGYHIAAGSLIYPIFDIFGDPIELLRRFWYIYWIINMSILYAAIKFLPDPVISLLSGTYSYRKTLQR